MKTATQVIGLVLAFLLFAVVLVVAVLFGPGGLSGSDFTWRQQEMIRLLNTPMPILGAVTIVLALVCAFLRRAQIPIRRAYLIGAFFLIFAGLVTRFGNQPINAVVMTWDPNHPPSDWQEFRDAWWHWHILRTVLCAAGFLSLAIGFNLGRRAPQK